VNLVATVTEARAGVGRGRPDASTPTDAVWRAPPAGNSPSSAAHAHRGGRERRERRTRSSLRERSPG
jgi:hypothetical protein